MPWSASNGQGGINISLETNFCIFNRTVEQFCQYEGRIDKIKAIVFPWYLWPKGNNNLSGSCV